MMAHQYARSVLTNSLGIGRARVIRQHIEKAKRFPKALYQRVLFFAINGLGVGRGRVHTNRWYIEKVTNVLANRDPSVIIGLARVIETGSLKSVRPRVREVAQNHGIRYPSLLFAVAKRECRKLRQTNAKWDHLFGAHN